MTGLITWLEAIVGSIPLPLLEVWGRFAYLVGLLLAVCAFGGFTFRVGDQWRFGRQRQTWNTKAFLSVPLTAVLVIASGYLGSFIVLVPGAQTFESLKDLLVLQCVVLFGYPALLAIPPAYMLSDLIEGVPPSFVLSWTEGYFFWTAFVWMAHQLIGLDPDFRRARTWAHYAVFVVLIMLVDPAMWGFICSPEFSSAISYRNISSALFFTLAITWLLAPAAFLVTLPLARRVGWFWNGIPGHVSARAIDSREWTWSAGGEPPRETRLVGGGGMPIRVFIFTPFIALVLVMVGATAIVALRSADDDATRLATRLHQEASVNIRTRLDDFLARSMTDTARNEALVSLLRSQAVGTNGRAFILDRAGSVIASSAPDGDPVIASAIAGLRQHTDIARPADGTEFSFDHVTARPLGRETWLTYATTYRDDTAARDWILVTAMPESFYLSGLQIGSSRSAMVFALTLVLSLLLAAALASTVTAPIRRISQVTRDMAQGDLSARVPPSRLEELDRLARSFNDMARRLESSFDHLVAEVDVRKRREHELEESEARLRASESRVQLAVDSAGLGVWDWDVEQDRLVWDDSMYRLYGVNKGDFTGHFDAWSRCVVPEDRARATSDVEASLRGEREFRSDFRVRRADGTIRTIRAMGQTIRHPDGRPLRMVGINRDVTDLIAAERERERLVHDLGERVKELRLLHATSRLLQRDRPFDRALLEQLVVLMPPAWQYPECCEAHIACGGFDVSTAGWRETPWKQSTSFATSDGTGLIEVAYLEPRPPSGEGPFLVEERALLDSLAEMLVAYLDLREHQERLEALVASRTNELRAAKEAAESASGAKSAFLANMSHEIRTPMNAILGYAQLLRRDPGLGAEHQQKIDIIHSSGSHLLTLINDILEMSKIEAGRTTLVAEPFDLHALLDDVRWMFRELTGNKGLALTFDRDSHLPRALVGDAGKIRQVLINLLSNAVKFTERGHIVVRVRSAAVAPARFDITIAVEDTGTGIPAAQLASIFDVFEQGDSKARVAGTGLGLAISRHFARLMNGDIVVESTPGIGSVFTFSFEADAGSIETVGGPAVAPMPVGLERDERDWKVLIVDDVPTNRNLLDELLSRIGFVTRAASSGEEALVTHDEWHPDLVLMDLRMPGLGGLEAVRRLRARGSKATIVAVTASSLAGAEREAHAAGADAFVRKPYRDSELLGLIGARLGVRYVYEPGDRPEAGPRGRAGRTTLAQRLGSLPPDLRDQLRRAAMEGRATRLETLADQARELSEEASAEIRTLARTFDYDALLSALQRDEKHDA